MKKKTRKFLFQIHLYLGLISGIPLVLVGVTGAILTVAPQIRQLDQPEFYDIEKEGDRISQIKLVEMIKASNPQTRLNHISMFD